MLEHGGHADTPTPEKKRKVGFTNNQVIVLTMPARCEAAMPGSTEKTTIRVLRDTVNTEFWIAAGDVSWLVLYLADEFVTQNASRKKPAVAGEELKSNCAFRFLHVGVDRTSGSSCECTFVGTFIDGPLKGESVRTCQCMFDETQWATCMKHPQRWGFNLGPFRRRLR